jgi:hypothetical protein
MSDDEKLRSIVDNREAYAYVIFRRFGCSRSEALACIDELAEMAPAIKRSLPKKWRRRRRAAKEGQ